MLAASTGHHFAGRGNRFWRVVHLAGFTPEQLQPEDDLAFLRYGYGLTTAVSRATARADELSRSEFEAAASAFEQKIDASRAAIYRVSGEDGAVGHYR